ncbi:ABC transporter ATP-binding protein [Gloeobacter violaceus]|uniref:Glr3472 protein n=1 Tax=Gloeobacter violaceus (strain ATCC 29082 / PCC 7421) TaxID=251221 RepID=Q7NFQ2_GLOVI|nr:ABC transporter ATP-binding protein [Gloeobacter violaceus]BAC91413.1 glr3472 [Gloeobacter violaceus PCC 7421]
MLLDACDLHKSYGERQAVAGLTFQVAAGEIFGLLGPNGAGKSTTIKMLAGLVRPDRGSVRVAGLELARSACEAKRLVGIVPQELAVYPGLSARDNLAFWGELYGLSGRRLAERIGAVLEVVGLAERGREPVERFSGGMQRRLNLAIGLIHEPRLLLLDEPTVGVDPQSRNRIFEGIEQLSRAGMAIVYTSHYLEEVERLCRRVAIVDGGRLVAEGTPAQLQSGAGHGLVVLTVQQPLEETAGALAALAGVVGVHQEEGSGRVTIAAERPQQVLVAALEVLGKAEIGVLGVQLIESSLEAVFLQLTGRSLRDES